MTVGNVRRWLYAGKRPNWIAKLANNAWAAIVSSGLAGDQYLTLEVIGRKSGKTISLPLVVADYEGQRYLVSMLGEDVQWVKNLRARGGQAVVKAGGRVAVQLEDVPVEQRAPIIKAYLQRATGAQPHIAIHKDAPLAAFEHIAPTLPVFHIRPVG